MTGNRFYDAVVIGSGFGGLGAAAMLAENDYRVLVLEKHGLYGGYATYFKRKRFLFDVSLHGYPWNFVEAVKDLFGANAAADMYRIKKIVTRTPQYRLETTFDFDDFSNILINKFKQNPESVRKFFERLKAVSVYDPPGESVFEFLNSYFPGRGDVHRFLLEIINIANGCTFEDPMKILCIVLRNFLTKGPFFCHAGTNVLVDRMVESLQERGVVLEKWKTAGKILLDDSGAVRGVEVHDRRGNVEIIKTNAVVSNANLLTTCRDMVGLEKFSDDFRGNLSKTRLSLSACQVYFGLREPLPFMGDILFVNEDEKFDPSDIRRDRPGCISFTMYYPDVRVNKYNSMTIGSTQLASWDNWQNLSGEQYQAKKDAMIETTYRHLEREIPGVRENIEYVTASTPLTMKRYTSHLGGAIYGTKYEGIEVADALPNEIPGLYYAGSVGLIMSGWLGTMLRGMTVSDDVDTYIMEKQKKERSVNV